MLQRIPEGGRLAVVRFSSLGDITLAAAALRTVARRRPDIQMILLTKSGFADLFARQSWLEVWPLAAPAGFADLRALAGEVRAWQPHVVADLHGTLRSWMLQALVPQPAWYRLHKRVLRRTLNVKFNLPDPGAGHVVERYGDVFGVTPDRGAWLDAAPVEPETQPQLALIPGAQWPTKVWPHARWPQVAAWWRDRGGRVVWVGGPTEKDGLAALAAADDEVLAGVPLADVVDRLAQCRLAVANDTGPGHIAAAVGTPVVSIFGPTVQSFGFTPWGPHRVVETEIDCRPCSLHGSAECPLGHHRCMLEIADDDVTAAASELLESR